MQHTNTHTHGTHKQTLIILTCSICFSKNLAFILQTRQTRTIFIVADIYTAPAPAENTDDEEETAIKGLICIKNQLDKRDDEAGLSITNNISNIPPDHADTSPLLLLDNLQLFRLCK